jgi:hypothetical protein
MNIVRGLGPFDADAVMCRLTEAEAEIERLQAEIKRLKGVIEAYERERLSGLGGIGSPA